MDRAQRTVDRPRHSLPSDKRKELLDAVSRSLALVPGIRLAWAFGSFVSGDAFHDLDIAVLLDDPDVWRALAQAEQAACDAIGMRDIPVDVLPLNDATYSFRHEIVRHGQVLWERTRGDALDFAVLAASQDIDHREWLRAHESQGRSVVRPERRRALREALEDLRRYRAQFDEAAFLSNRDAQRLVMQALYVAVQASLDEALEACKERGLESGDRYREAFLALGKAGVLEAGLAASLADWASFRNVLAHFYPVIDLRRVYRAIDDLGDLEAFAAFLASVAT